MCYHLSFYFTASLIFCTTYLFILHTNWHDSEQNPAIFLKVVLTLATNAIWLIMLNTTLFCLHRDKAKIKLSNKQAKDQSLNVTTISLAAITGIRIEATYTNNKVFTWLSHIIILGTQVGRSNVNILLKGISYETKIKAIGLYTRTFSKDPIGTFASFSFNILGTWTS